MTEWKKYNVRTISIVSTGSTLTKEIEWQTGYLHGLYVVMDKHGVIRQKSNYVNSQLHGKEIEWSFGRKGRIFKESTYNHNKLHGIQKTWWFSGQKLCQWCKGRFIYDVGS
jgi:antitoxin component YwqK of YwqJK toxin-antitoxin module